MGVRSRGHSGKSEIIDLSSAGSAPEVETPGMANLFTLYRYATKLDYFLIAAGVLIGLIQGVVQSCNSLIFRHLTDALIEGQALWTIGLFDYPTFELNSLIAIQNYAMFGALVFILGFLSMSCWHTVAIRQAHKIRERYFAAVLRQNMAWFDKNETGMLTTKMSEGMDRIKDGTGDKVGVIACYITQFVASMVVALTMSWKMTLVILAFTPIFFGPMGFTSFLITKITPQEQKLTGKVGAVAEEVISGIRTVIAFNGQRREIDRYSTTLSSMATLGSRKAFLTSSGIACIFLAMFVSMAVSFYFGTTLVIAGEVSAGTTFAVFWAVIGSTSAVGQAAPQMAIISSALSAAAPIFEVIDRVPPIDSKSEEGIQLGKIRGEVEYSNIHFTYPSRPDAPILRGVSLKVKPGEHIALVGHSGCGKSTLVGLLLRYYDNASGKVTIDGIDVSSVNIRSLRNAVGLVSQEPALFADTIENNLRLGNPEMSAADMERVCRAANAHDFIMKLPLGYASRIGDGGVQLSGGQKQRVAIARALARNPTILLLDEATSALDTESESIVQTALDKAGEGRTTIAIAHRLSTIKNSDRIYVFEKGVIVESGSHEQLMAADGHYRQLVRAQEIEKAEEKEKKELRQSIDSAKPMFARGISEVSRASSHFKRRSTVGSRASRRLSRAFSVASSKVEHDIEELKEDAAEENVNPSSLWTIIMYSRQEWWMLAVGVIFSIVRGLTFPLFSILYGSMFKSLSEGDDESKLHGARINAIWFSCLGIMAFVSTLTSGWLLARAGEFITKRMRISLFTNIVQQDGAYFDELEHAPGRLTTRLALDAPNIRAAIDQRLADVLQGISSICASIIIAFTYGPAMAPIGIVTALTLMGIQTLASKYLKQKGEKDAVKSEEPARLATEAIEQHKTVAYLTREDHFVEEFRRGMHGPYRIIQSLTYGLFTSYMCFNFAAAYRYGIWLVYVEKVDPYTVFQVIEALNVASMGLMAFATYFPEYVRARLSAGLLFKMLNLAPSIDSLTEEGEKHTLRGEVRFCNTEFAYPSRKQHKVLDGLNFVANPGQTVALVGQSGCGKSTTIQLVERFYDPCSGSVQFDGKDLRSYNVRHFRSQVALVGQEPTLFNYSIKDNIAYGMPDASMAEIEAAARLANAHNFITGLPEGYETPVGERGGQLSGGQKQRIAIARAVILNPKILLLDEATSALDTESEKVVQQALDSAREGRTCIVIAHRLSSIQNSDVILVCKDGRVAERGSHQELLALKGLYAALVEKQQLS